MIKQNFFFAIFFFASHLIFTVSGEQKALDLEQSFPLHNLDTSPCSEERSQLSKSSNERIDTV